MSLVHYGYFVVLPNGLTAPSGDDWGPTADTYKVGTSLGVKSGIQATVVGVIRGEAAKRNGFDVIVLVEQYPVGSPPSSGVSRVAINEATAYFVRGPLPSQVPPTIQMPWTAKNVRMVAIWNKLYPRPLTETFHEFLIEVPLKGTLLEDWYKRELTKPEGERHDIEKWLRSFREEGRKNRPAGHQPGQVYSAPATGATIELIALAHDLYMLQKVNRLPEKLVERLRNYNEFQGVRYEIAIAAAFVKCGFEIEWIEDRSGPHPEFIARHSRTGEEVAVETKSRRRPGVLHHPGSLPQENGLRADVERLYREAIQQNPKTVPFAIFLDVNLPPSTDPNEVGKWRGEIVSKWQGNEQIALLGFTNFAWHYRFDEHVPFVRPEILLSMPLNSSRPLRSAQTIRCLQAALDSYGVCPNEY